jgi:phosphate uptake regulator
LGLFDLFRDDTPAPIRKASQQMGEVIDIARSMWSAAVSHLLFSVPLEVSLQEMDDGINARERSIRKAVFKHIEKQPHEDLVLSLALVSTVQDGERIGDWVKHIGALAQLTEKPLLGPRLSTLRSAGEQITKMFDKTYKGFVDGDVKSAREVMVDSTAVKSDLRVFIEDVASADDLSVNAAVVLSSAALMMGRVSSHLSNIASSVVLPYERIRGPVDEVGSSPSA